MVRVCVDQPVLLASLFTEIYFFSCYELFFLQACEQYQRTKASAERNIPCG